MMLHGGATPKRTVCWSNSFDLLQSLACVLVRNLSLLAAEDKGPLPRSLASSSEVSTTRPWEESRIASLCAAPREVQVQEDGQGAVPWNCSTSCNAARNSSLSCHGLWGTLGWTPKCLACSATCMLLNRIAFQVGGRVRWTACTSRCRSLRLGDPSC